MLKIINDYVVHDDCNFIWFGYSLVKEGKQASKRKKKYRLTEERNKINKKFTEDVRRTLFINIKTGYGTNEKCLN